MKTILDTITEHKRMEVLKRKGIKPLTELKKKPLFDREPLDPVSRFNDGNPGIIAEFKRKSPSKGMLAPEDADPVEVVGKYKTAGAVCASVLTDRDFFGGSFRDLEDVKLQVQDIPLLRKDFMIDPYQVYEARAYGADIILLIAAILDKETVQELSKIATDLGLTVLLEIHEPKEMEVWNPLIKMVGVNNRNLKDFSVDINRSLELVNYIPDEVIRVSESGLQKAEDIHKLTQAGYQAFLMGEHFMTKDDPGLALGSFINSLKQEK